MDYEQARNVNNESEELFKKKLEGLPLTKTEREYYSRTVRKKVSALANPELHRLAHKLLNYCRFWPAPPSKIVSEPITPKIALNAYKLLILII